jgi:signal transduction histidine kinase
MVIERLGRALRMLRGSPVLADGTLVVALSALAVASDIGVVAPAAAATGQYVPSGPVIVAWALALTCPLLLRRRFPCTVLALSATHFVAYWAVGLDHEVVAWLVVGVAVYSAVAYGRRRGELCAAVAAVATTLGLLVKTALMGHAPAVQVVVFAANNALPYVLGSSLGLMTRRLRESRAALQQRNRELDRERERNTRRAVLEERVHIARELHDVVAHHVAVMGIQAGVAHRLFDTDPAEARTAVSAVQAGSRQAITELQQLLGMLRSHDDDNDNDHLAGREPAPGLDQLPELADSVRRAGLAVELVVTGGPPGPGLELSAYRIVQEALTNSLKHADATGASVTVHCGEREVRVEVLDDGRGPGTAVASGGRGLAGMRERVGVHGGRLEVGPGPGGGFRVHAVLGGPR